MIEKIEERIKEINKELAYIRRRDKGCCDISNEAEQLIKEREKLRKELRKELNKVKVYAVIYDWVDNFEGNNNVVLFNDYEKAKEYFKELKKEIKTEYNYDSFGSDVPYEFYGYNEGTYPEKHDRVRIEELEVK